VIAINNTIIVTGGAGFIGSNFIRNWLARKNGKVINLDLLTYAGCQANLLEYENNPDYVFVKGDIADRDLITNLLSAYAPRAILNFAAESHVDRSITGPEVFIKTNIFGTFNLLECSREYWIKLEGSDKQNFRFLHISTDEVYGTLKQDDPAFSEDTPYQPNSPYSASKAGSDHLVRAWYHTYGLPILTTNCSNNYGPYQYPEKLIPLVISNALEQKMLPVYGDGKNIRDWLHVDDHCDGISAVLEKGQVGQCYNIGASNERTNIEIVELICKILDKLKPLPNGSYTQLMSFVKDRAGHDRRYAINASKIQNELGWKARISFEEGIENTIKWYLSNLEWTDNIKNKIL
jgi:dTDP-glucose 4,6-dehydratase